MTKRIFITSTNTNIGKTNTTILLINEFSQKGLRIGVFKPIETGVEVFPLDGMGLLEEAKIFNTMLQNFPLETVVPYQFALPAAPYVAKGSTPIELYKLDEALAQIESLCDIVLIEGAGGLMVPIEKNLFMIDLIKYWNATVFLVTPSKLGAINDTLLSLEALRRENISHLWGVNLYDDEDTFNTISKPFFEDYFKDFFIIQKDISTIAEKLLLQLHNSF